MIVNKQKHVFLRTLYLSSERGHILNSQGSEVEFYVDFHTLFNQIDLSKYSQLFFRVFKSYVKDAADPGETLDRVTSEPLSVATTYYPMSSADSLHIDNSSNSLHATNVGVTHTVTPERPAAVLDGNAHLDMSAHAAEHTATQFSLSFWVKPDGGGTVVGMSNSANYTNNHFRVTITPAGLIEISLLLPGAAAVTETSFTPLPTGQWSHVALTYGVERKARIWIDGVLDTTSADLSASLVDLAPTTMVIGGLPGSPIPLAHYAMGDANWGLDSTSAGLNLTVVNGGSLAQTTYLGRPCWHFSNPFSTTNTPTAGYLQGDSIVQQLIVNPSASISFWFLKNQVVNVESILSVKDEQSGGFFAGRLYVFVRPNGSTGQIAVEYNPPDGGPSTFMTDGAIDVTDGAWHHICILFSEQDKDIYVDGNLVTTVTNESTDALDQFEEADVLTVGGFRPNTAGWVSRMLDAYIGDMRFYDSLLSPNAIKTLAEVPDAGPPLLSNQFSGQLSAVSTYAEPERMFTSRAETLAADHKWAKKGADITLESLAFDTNQCLLLSGFKHRQSFYTRSMNIDADSSYYENGKNFCFIPLRPASGLLNKKLPIIVRALNTVTGEPIEKNTAIGPILLFAQLHLVGVPI